MNDRKKLAMLDLWLFWVSLACLLLMVGSMLAFRFELLVLKPVFIGLAVGLLGCLVVGLVALLLWIGTLLWRHTFVGQLLLVVILCALPMLTLLVTVGISGMKKPPIHDISTDTTNPPVFVWAAKDRLAGDNSVEYEGVDLARRQREAYPNITPLNTTIPTERAFRSVKDTVGELGWRELGRDEELYRIEALDQTRLFGFKDDVVVRVTPVDGGSRIDVRSASRLGLGDLGANAKRIENFFKALEKHLRVNKND